MIKSFFKIALRNIFRNRVYSIINISSLSIGLAACLLVANVVIDDFSYDKRWKHSPDIYRVCATDESTGKKVPVVLSGVGPGLERNFPEIEKYCRVSKREGDFADSIQEKFNLSYLETEPSFLDMFDFKFLQRSALIGKSGYKSVIITKEIKDKYFADINPVGRRITGFLRNGNVDSMPYIVTGVIESFPYNSHLRAEAIVLKASDNENNQLSQFGVGYFTSLYVLLKKGSNVKNLPGKIDKWYNSKVEKEQYQKFDVQPLKNVYLYSDFAKGYQPVIGSIRNVYIFSAVAIVLLLIACFNFVNLTIARSLKRIAEAGVRKVLGAGRLQLVLQFLFESLIFFAISFLLSVILYRMFIGGVEKYLGHTLTISFTQNISLLTTTVLILLLVCVFAGFYPSILLAGTKMALALKGVAYRRIGDGLVRKVLVIGQFAIAIVIIIAAIVVKEQVFFLNNSDLGYDKNNLLAIGSTNLGDKGMVFKNEVKKVAGIESVSITGWNPGLGGGSMTINIDDLSQKDKKIEMWFIYGDVDFVSTLKLRLLQGRELSNDFALDVPNIKAIYKTGNFDSLAKVQSHQSLLLSEYAAKFLDSPELNIPSKNVPGVPVGVVSDFHNESLRTIMKPLAIKADNNISYGNVIIRVQPGFEKTALSSISRIWSSVYPSQALEYSWVADALELQYQSEKKTQQLFFFFSYLSIFLACMGLFGLVSFTTEMRVKEIGIRKVLGASAAIITTMISKEFLKLVVIAIIISAPVALWLMHKWLQDYAYRIDVSWWFVTIAGLTTILISLVTICFGSIKAAMANPVKSLKTE